VFAGSILGLDGRTGGGPGAIHLGVQLLYSCVWGAGQQAFHHQGCALPALWNHPILPGCHSNGCSEPRDQANR